MSAFSTCCTSFATLSRAAAKAASSRLRQFGLLPTKIDWARRAETCERCPLRVVHRNVSYCGKPMLQQIDRDPTLDGCGCPIRAKARDPQEHCPLTPRHLPSTPHDESCDCKWCAIEPH